MISHLGGENFNQPGQYPAKVDLGIPTEPRDQWTRTSDGLVSLHKSPTRTIYSLDRYLLEADYEKALDELSLRISSHKKRDGELVQVNFEFWVAENWKSILKQLSALLLNMQKQLSFIDFSLTDFSWDHLTNLFEVYESFEDQKTFPFVLADRTKVLYQASKRKFIKDLMMREEKVKVFFKKVIIDHRSLFSCFENDCFNFYDI